MRDELSLRLMELFSPTVEAAGMELYHVELFGQPGRLVVRVYLDKPEGVNLDDCAVMSRALSALLDVEDPITGRYSLEVGSPGLDRPLVTLDHFRRVVGREIKLRTQVPQAGKRRNFEGTLKSVDDSGMLELTAEDSEIRIPLADVARAHVVYRFEEKNPKRKGSHK